MLCIIVPVQSVILSLFIVSLLRGREKGMPMFTLITGRVNHHTAPLIFSVPVIPTGSIDTPLFDANIAAPGNPLHILAAVLRVDSGNITRGNPWARAWSANCRLFFPGRCRLTGKAPIERSINRVRGLRNSSSFAMNLAFLPREIPINGGSALLRWFATTSKGPCAGTCSCPVTIRLVKSVNQQTTKNSPILYSTIFHFKTASIGNYILRQGCEQTLPTP